MALQSLQHLKIPFQEIKSLTDNFDELNKIGDGGFGKVYKGEHSKHGTVAIKRLESSLQGNVEFLNEITILSLYHHENLISLVGFCDDNGEMIIVYEYALNNSLDKCLNKKSLTWMQCLKISVGAARGLHYLHTCPGHQQRVIHRDIKSANILLNEKWEAKISDFGLSKLGPKDQEQTFVITGVAGTNGYCDPQYVKTNLLRKESDVFSFGVVLLEVLCGRINSKHELVRMAQLGELVQLVDETLLEQIDKKCFYKFVAITCKCVSESHETRPRMDYVVEELEKALGFQERMEGRMSQPILHISPSFDKGQFSHGNGMKCHMLLARELSIEHVEKPQHWVWKSLAESRFREVAELLNVWWFDISGKVKTEMLSPETTYAAYLVFKLEKFECWIDYPLEAMSLDKYGHSEKTKTICLKPQNRMNDDVPKDTIDGWMEIELCQFNKKEIADRQVLNIRLKSDGKQLWGLIVAGMEFRPKEI